MHANSEAWTRRAGPGKAAGAGRETRIIPQAPAGFQRGGRDQEMVARGGDSNGRGMGRWSRKGRRDWSFRGCAAARPSFPHKSSFPRRRESRDLSAISPHRHSREGGNPETSAPSLQVVIPAKAGSALLRRSRTSRAFRARAFEVAGFPLSRE
ncbi:hypothetical protein LG3211_4105 [Lysobacter gummosus]|nr:hypothetical protein LG3211_4105 [Lysobacter gummosus]